jgi:hypothetical protein
VFRLRAKKLRLEVNDRTLPAYRELVTAGIMVPDADGFQFTEDGWKQREEWISAAEAHINSLKPPLPDGIDLSEGARKVLARHLAGDDEVTDANRPAYRELASAGIMMPAGSFTKGDECVYRFTQAGWERRFEFLGCAKESA